MSLDPQRCLDQYTLVMTVGYRMGQCLHFAANVFCLIMCYRVHWGTRRKIYVHPNLQPLIYLLFGFAAGHCIIEMGFQVHHMFLWYGASDPCMIMMSNRECIYVSAPFFGCVVGMVVVVLAMSFERTVATICTTQYEKLDEKWIRYLLVGFVVVVTAALVYYAHRNVIWEETRPSCGMMSISVQQNAVEVYHILFCIDVVTLFVFLVIYKINLRLSGRVPSIRYELGKQYQVRENVSVVRLIYPTVFVHLLIFLVFLVSYGFIKSRKPYFDQWGPYAFRMVSLYANIIPYYTALMPVVYMVNLRRLQRGPVKIVDRGLRETEVYFLQLESQWGTQNFLRHINRVKKYGTATP